ncbi:MAG: hypothetical protein ACLPY5_09400 [Candidatus Bathyarchaeia archaeon]
MRKVTANSYLTKNPPTIFGFDVPTSTSGFPRCPFCRSKEYANLKHLQQHMLWKHWTKLENRVPPT